LGACIFTRFNADALVFMGNPPHIPSSNPGVTFKPFKKFGFDKDLAPIDSL
jgi:hypothetical protein